MLTDPSLDIQGAIVAAVKTATAATVSNRVYDAAPASPTFPYITIGDGQVAPELGEQTNSADTIIQIDVWSRAVGYPEAKSIAKTIISALHDANLTVPNNKNVSILFETANYLRDPDGLTRHAALTFSIQTDAA
jgi:hypothetical protein